MVSERNYGKLTPADIKSLFLLLPQLENERQELQAAIAQKPEKFAAEFLSTGFAWAHLYEVPFLQFLNSFFAVAGLDKAVADVTTSENPVEALFGLTDATEDMEWSGGAEGKYTPGDLLGYLHAVVANFDCLLIYGSYLNDLVAEAKKGDFEALYKAIRIDPSVVTGPTARNLLSFAVIAGNQGLIGDIRNAMSGKTDKQDKKLAKFRLLMQTLHEVGALDLSTKEIMELVLEVDAYDTTGEREFTAEKNIRELILKAKSLKKNTISK